MCGVIGVIGTENAAFEIYNGLNLLQHRGQDSSGILTFNDNDLHIRRKQGLVNLRYTKSDLKKLKGSLGIGQVRYPTVGSDLERDSQPFFTNYPFGIGMAHNGNIVNFEDLKDTLKAKDKRHVYSNCDVELIMNVFASELGKLSLDNLKTDDGAYVLKKTMSRLNGSYSVVCAIADKGLLAFRDPRGIRPLIFGIKQTLKDKSYLFASESVVLDSLGYTVIRDVNPGEAIFIDNNLKVHSRSLFEEKPRHCMFEWVYFSRPDSVIENQSVYDVRLNLGKALAAQWKSKKSHIDVVVPVPDSSRPIALAFAEALGIPYREGLVKNRYVGRTFIMASQDTREKAVRAKLSPVVRELKGKRVALIDDSIVRGTTSKQIVEMVKKAGAIEVHFISACPELKFPCFYGVDMSSKEDLLASSKSVKEIKEHINADSVTYQSIDGLVEAIGMPRENLCMGCLNHDYPTEVPKSLEAAYARMRDAQRNGSVQIVNISE